MALDAFQKAVALVSAFLTRTMEVRLDDSPTCSRPGMGTGSSQSHGYARVLARGSPVQDSAPAEGVLDKYSCGASNIAK
jgi:hypothetical protein